MEIKDELFLRLREYRPDLKGEISLDTSFDQLGFDSIDKLELLLKIEEGYDITFPDDLTVNNMGELIAKIKELKN